MTDIIPTPDTLTDSASEGQADPSTVASLPEWAQRMIRDLRTEAATHRTALQEVTGERDTARAAMVDRHRADALNGLSKTLADPDDLGRFTDLDELVDEAGNPDPGKYQAAAAALALERPHLGVARPARSGNPVGGGGAQPLQGIDAAKAGQEAFVSMFHGS